MVPSKRDPITRSSPSPLDDGREILHRIRLVGVAITMSRLAPRRARRGRRCRSRALLADDGRTVLRCDFGGAIGGRVVDDDHLARVRNADALERLVDDRADRLLSFKQGITTEISRCSTGLSA